MGVKGRSKKQVRIRMGTLIPNNKKYVVIEEKEFDNLQLPAAKKHAYALIDLWEKEK